MLTFRPTHPAWEKASEAQWVTLGPGVRWLLRRPNGAEEAWASAQTAQSLMRLIEARAELEALNLAADDMGPLADMERLTGLGVVFTACVLAPRLLEAWEGVEDPATGEPLEITAEAIKACLLSGTPAGGRPLLSSFAAWLEGPARPMVAEAMRLRQRAKDGWSGGFDRCRACREEGDACSKGVSEGGEICPQIKARPVTVEGEAAWEVCQASGLWVRAGMAGMVSGLDYRAALLAMEAKGVQDMGAAFKALQAIEAGRIEAEVERAEAQTAGSGQVD